MHKWHHDGRCKFTPDGSASVSTARELIQTLTAGDVESLSGLDDIRVLKGCNNFQVLQDTAKNICKPNKINPIVEAIDKAELYYQTD